MIFRYLDAITAQNIVRSMKLMEKVTLVLNLHNDVHRDEAQEDISVAETKIDAIVFTVLPGSFDSFLVKHATELQDYMNVLHHYNNMRFSNSMRFIDDFLKLLPLVIRCKFPQLVKIMRNSPVFTFAEFNHYFPEFLHGMSTEFFGFFVNQGFVLTPEDIETESASFPRHSATLRTIPEEHAAAVQLTASLMRLMLLDGKRDFPSEIHAANRAIESARSDPEKYSEAVLVHEELSKQFGISKKTRATISLYVETQMQPSFARFKAIGRSPPKRCRRLD